MEADGYGILSLTPTATGNFSSRVAYSPSGDRIAFVMNARIHVMNADGTGKAEIALERATDATRVIGVNWLP